MVIAVIVFAATVLFGIPSSADAQVPGCGARYVNLPGSYAERAVISGNGSTVGAITYGEDVGQRLFVLGSDGSNPIELLSSDSASLSELGIDREGSILGVTLRPFGVGAVDEIVVFNNGVLLQQRAGSNLDIAASGDYSFVDGSRFVVFSGGEEVVFEPTGSLVDGRISDDGMTAAVLSRADSEELTSNITFEVSVFDVQLETLIATVPNVAVPVDLGSYVSKERPSLDFRFIDEPQPGLPVPEVLGAYAARDDFDPARNLLVASLILPANPRPFATPFVDVQVSDDAALATLTNVRLGVDIDTDGDDLAIWRVCGAASLIANDALSVAIATPPVALRIDNYDPDVVYGADGQLFCASNVSSLTPYIINCWDNEQDQAAVISAIVQASPRPEGEIIWIADTNPVTGLLAAPVKP